MKSLDFVFVGAARNPAYKNLEAFYHERITHYVKVSNIVLIKDSVASDLALKQKQDSQNILEQLTDKDVVVVCDERGKACTSPEFAKKIENFCARGPRVVFVVGGAYGMSDALRARADFTLRLTDFVLPHELARVVLLEQVYRGFSILKGERYHH